MILLIFVSAMLLFGITTKVERLAKFIMPALILMLIICGVYACTITDGAAGGLKYYLLPDFSKFTVKVFADAVTQVSVLGGHRLEPVSLPSAQTYLIVKNNLKSDALFVSFADTFAAVLAGFVIIPSAFGAGIDVQKGRRPSYSRSCPAYSSTCPAGA